jgi:hypothetical protein
MRRDYFLVVFLYSNVNDWLFYSEHQTILLW